MKKIERNEEKAKAILENDTRQIDFSIIAEKIKK